MIVAMGNRRSIAGFAMALAVFVATGVVAPCTAVAEPICVGAKRALLIGNGSYAAADAPANVPVRNAQSLAEELRRNGFSVELHENLRKDAMSAVLRAFAEKIERGDCALLFFSGYAIQVEGSTYLVPVDADIWTEKDVALQSIGLSAITGAFESAGAEAQVVVLDASRRNPFERRFRTFSSGLGPIALPDGSLSISAAGVGEVADDGDGETSVFLSELLKEMRAPDLTVQEIFERTRTGVDRATNGAQRPYVLSTTRQELYLGPHKGTPAPPPAGAESSPTVGTPVGEPLPGSVFRDCDRCPDLVVIAPGAFDMGSDDFETEKPVHRAVITKPFAMGRFEVTLAQWDACVADGACTGRPSGQDRGQENLPAAELSWHDAVAYVEWLGRVSGQVYRLPTETEWEYAARGGTATAFWWGADVGVGFSNCRGCGGNGGRRAAAVGAYRPNPFGLFDTAGNVAEWVADCWADSYRDVQSEASRRATGACKQRVVRGGSFDSGPRYVRSASRFPYDPDLRYYANGLRVLRELPRAEGRIR